MQITRRQFAQDVLLIIHEVCRVIYNLRSNQDVERVFGIAEEKLESTINTIVDSLPEELFNQENHKKIKNLEQIFAKEFIFFQIQEAANDPGYQHDLANFIALFSK